MGSVPATPVELFGPARRVDGIVGEAVPDLRLTIVPGAPADSVRSAVRSVVQMWGVAVPVDDVLLVITELVQNVSRHTSGPGELRLTLHQTAVLVEVRDLDARPPVLCAPGPRQPGGRGLMIVAAVASRWGYRPASEAGPSGKVVWAEFRLDDG